MPTSTTTAPAAMASGPRNFGTPIAATTMSAAAVTFASSRVPEWQFVTVALPLGPFRDINSDRGRPTITLRPTIATFLPGISIP